MADRSPKSTTASAPSDVTKRGFLLAVSCGECGAELMHCSTSAGTGYLGSHMLLHVGCRSGR